VSALPTLTKREITWLLSYCSKDISRSKLRQVLFSGSHAYASNGFTLAQLTFPAVFGVQITVPMVALERAVKLMSLNDVCTVESDRLLVVSGKDDVASLMFALSKEPFPPVDEVIKLFSEKAGPDGCIIKAAFLRNSCAIGDLADSGVRVQLGLTPSDICRLSATNTNGRGYTAYIMPMRDYR
jgi:hypothetical protein